MDQIQVITTYDLAHATALQKKDLPTYESTPVTKVSLHLIH